MSKAEYIKNNFDIAALREVGFLTTEKTIPEIEARICKWFGIKNIYMYDHIVEDKSLSVKADINTFSEN